MHELRSWRKERNAAYLYRILSDSESGNPRQLMFLELARDADEQADLWATEIRKARLMPPVGYVPDIRIKLVARLIRWLGPQQIVPLLRLVKLRGLSVYSSTGTGRYAPIDLIDMAGQAEPELRYSAGLRSAVVGINDGLVSITLLVAGIAGATSESATILLTGVVGLLAGASLMAAGECLSLRSQREIAEKHHRLKQEIAGPYPAEETQELALIYQDRGMSREDAYTLAKRMIDDPELGQDVLAQEALAVNPQAPGSLWQAATFSFFAFVAGGLIPLLPFLLEVRRHPLLMAVSLSCVGLFAVGAALARLSGRQALWGGLRMLLIGVAAGSVSYATGNLLGAKIS